ncbi:MAG: hypothetical protein J6W82_05010 [Bacteroidales bacterium]|nr:hypothetical protein [Bacteroidales bacterium]
MTSENGTPMYMPVAPAYGGFGGGFGGGDGWWIILLFIAMMGGGWGGMGGFGGGYDFPWLLAGQNQINSNTNSGFDHAATLSSLSGIQSAVTSGFGDVATQLCGGFAGVNASVNGAQAMLSQQLYTNEIASLERSFAEQTANSQGFTGLQAQLAQCCCDNRLATCQTQNLVATESAATRAEIQRAVQAVLDKMCQDKIDSKNELIVGLNNKINALESNNYIQNALTAQTQYFLSLYPTTTGAARTA